MRKKIGTLIVSLSLLLAISCIGQARAGEPPDAYEPNDTLATARALVPGTYTDMNCDHLGDVDCYNISVQKDYTLIIKLTNDDVGTTKTLQLNDSSSTTLETKTIPESSSNSIAQVATYTGNYTIRIDSTGGHYTLEISITAPGTGTDGISGFDVVLVILSIFAGFEIVVAFRKKRALVRS